MFNGIGMLYNWTKQQLKWVHKSKSILSSTSPGGDTSSPLCCRPCFTVKTYKADNCVYLFDIFHLQFQVYRSNTMLLQILLYMIHISCPKNALWQVATILTQVPATFKYIQKKLKFHTNKIAFLPLSRS